LIDKLFASMACRSVACKGDDYRGLVRTGSCRGTNREIADLAAR
jgi:hypothetical protein